MQVLQMQTVITKRHVLQVNARGAGRCELLIPLLQLDLTSATNLHFTCIMFFNTVLLNQATPNTSTKHLTLEPHLTTNNI